MGWPIRRRGSGVEVPMSGKRVLVTGATGFVGSHLVGALLARGHSVRAVARNLPDPTPHISWLPDVDFVQADLHSHALDIDRLTEGMDSLVHLAWPGLPNYRELFHYETNLMADYRFVKAAVERGISQVMVTGTCFEYGMRNGLLNEEMVAEPNNPYGLAKNALRLFLQALQQVQPFSLQWVRLFYLHGPGQSPRSLLAALDRAIDEGEQSFNMSPGDQLRDFLTIETAASYLVRLLESDAFSGIVNCASGEPVSVRSLVERRIKERGASISLNLGYYPYANHEPMAFWGDRGKLEKLLELGHDKK